MENLSGNVNPADDSFIDEDFKTPPASPETKKFLTSRQLEKPNKLQTISKVSSDSTGSLIKDKIATTEFKKEWTISFMCLQGERGEIYDDLKEIKQITESSDFFSFNFKVVNDQLIKEQSAIKNVLLHAKYKDKLVFSIGIDEHGKVVKWDSDFIIKEPKKINLLFSNNNPYAPNYATEKLTLAFSILFIMPKKQNVMTYQDEDSAEEDNYEYYSESDNQYSDFDSEIEWQEEMTQGRAFFERPSKQAKTSTTHSFEESDREAIQSEEIEQLPQPVFRS